MLLDLKHICFLFSNLGNQPSPVALDVALRKSITGSTLSVAILLIIPGCHVFSVDIVPTITRVVGYGLGTRNAPGYSKTTITPPDELRKDIIKPLNLFASC